MKIYLEVGDILKVIERREDMSRKLLRVQCVEKIGCVGCHFRELNCESLLCSRIDRLDGKSVIFTEVNEEGGAE